MPTSRKIAAVIVAQLALTPVAHAACNDTQPDTRYALNGAEVYDSKTNLTWQRCSLGQTWSENKCTGSVTGMTWDQANKAAQSAKSGWRLPTRQELQSVLQNTCGLSPGDKLVFPDLDIMYSTYWSATTSEPALAWLVGFNNASTFNGFRTAPNAVRLVRTGK